jgi:hypothetical protein
VQSAGGALQITETYPRSRDPQNPSGEPYFSDNRVFLEKRREYHERATTPYERQSRERLVVIKEAAGNSCVALLIGTVTLLLDGGVEIALTGGRPPTRDEVTKVAVPVLVSALLAFALLRQHKRASRNEADSITLLTDLTEPKPKAEQAAASDLDAVPNPLAEGERVAHR